MDHIHAHNSHGTIRKKICLVMFNNPYRQIIPVVSLAEIITYVDEVDLIMFNSISNPIQKSNKNNLDIVQLAAIVEVICNSMTMCLYIV